jgi:Fibronectin type III domain
MAKFIFLFFILLISVSLRAQTIIAPDELEAEAQDSSYIKVTWHDNSNNEAGFYIERTLVNDSAYWEIIGESPQNVRIFFDYYVTRGRQYYYRVFAFNGPVRSAYSNIDSATLGGDPYVIPNIPSDLIITDVTPVTITIHWNDNSNNEDGFIIARKTQDDLYYHYIATVGPDILTYQDVGLTTDNLYTYKVCSFNEFGISEYSNIVSARTTKSSITLNNSGEVPTGYFLGNNYPNPFNPSTNIKFGIPFNSFVELKIYNSIGIEVESMLGNNLSAGTYQVRWNAGNYTSGIYFYRLIVNGVNPGKNNFTEVKKMILIK